MKKQEVWNKLIEALNLKVGDAIVQTTIYKYFSKSVKKGRPVKLTYVPSIYELFQDKKGNYYFKERFERIIDDNPEIEYGETEYNYNFPFLLFEGFEMYHDAKYTQTTIEHYQTRELYYKAYPNQDIWKSNEETEETFYYKEQIV